MNLYFRDYTKTLTKEEKGAVQAMKVYEEKKGFKCTSDDPRFAHQNMEIRNFLWHYTSLFPNNSLNGISVKDLDLEKEAKEFHAVIYRATNENDIQSYIKTNSKWFIPASIYKEYNFGHHGAYIFPEQQLGVEYRADYMLLGRSSDGYSVVLIEFEKANTDFTITSSNTESDSVRKGLTQIKDWKRWIDENKHYFLNCTGLANKGINIPTSRIFYCLVVSRRDRMTEIAKDVRSQLMYEHQNLKIISFDRLVDNIKKLSNGY